MSKGPGFGWGAVLALVIVLLAVGGAFAVGSATGDEAPRGDKAGIAVSGTGSVDAVPDEARFAVGVRAKAQSVGAAMDAMTADLRKVRKALRASDVRGKDIQTESLNVEASYSYANNRETIDGYVATQQLSVQVRDLGKAGEVMSAAASAGGDSVSISNLRLVIGDTKGLLAQARAKAIDDARASAAQFAEAAGRELGTVAFVQEDTKERDRVFNDGLEISRDSLDAAAVKEVPISAGEQKVTVKVNVRWTLR